MSRSASSIDPSVLGFCLLVVVGCSDDDGLADGGGSTTVGRGTTEATMSGGADATSGLDGATTTALGMSESGVIDPCEDAQVIPPPPVDCSGADGVLTQSVTLGEGGDDPSILEGVRRVEGAIRINQTELTNLDFMACVQEVGGDVTIFGNAQLTDVGGLWSLREIGTDFVLGQNDALEAFDGLPNVSVIPGSVVVRENASLRRLDGFHRLEELQGLGVDPETGETFGGNLTIQENPVLERIDGLIGLRVIRGRFQVTNDPMLCRSSVQSVAACIEEPLDPPPDWCSVEPNGCNADC